MRIGAHISTAGDYRKMISYADEVGCETFAIFAKSPRMWLGSPTTPEKGAQLRALLAVSTIPLFYTHTGYLINLSTSDDRLRAQSIEALADELVRGALLGAAAVNTHVGSDATSPAASAARRAAEALVMARDHAQAVLDRQYAEGAFFDLSIFGTEEIRVPRLLLENAAGSGMLFGTTIEELAAIIALTSFSQDELGICIDTCHAWAAGYDVSSESGWTTLLDQIENTMGLSRLGLLHANDSRYGRGMHKDRHAEIGKGTIGGEGFRAMMNETRLHNVDVILEVPGEVPRKDLENIARLKGFRGSVRQMS